MVADSRSRARTRSATGIRVVREVLAPAGYLAATGCGHRYRSRVADCVLPTTYCDAQELQAKFWLMLEHSFDEPSCLYRLAPTNTLWLLQGDARESLDQELGEFDAIYFDAFSPATNPELWHESLFRKILPLLKSDGLLVSYCVSGVVRRALGQAGYQVNRLPGPPGGKREVLLAMRQAQA